MAKVGRRRTSVFTRKSLLLVCRISEIKKEAFYEAIPWAYGKDEDGKPMTYSKLMNKIIDGTIAKANKMRKNERDEI